MSEFVSRLFWAMGALIALWIGSTIKDLTVSVNGLKELVARIDVQLKASDAKHDQLRQEFDRLNAAMYEHVTEDDKRFRSMK